MATRLGQRIASRCQWERREGDAVGRLGALPEELESWGEELCWAAGNHECPQELLQGICFCGALPVYVLLESGEQMRHGK